jgi:hypothetical protein
MSKHERRVVGHVSGWQEQMNTCVCGKPWPCPEVALSSNQRDIQVAAVMEAQKRWPALRDSTEARERSAFMAGVTFVLTQSSHTTPETRACRTDSRLAGDIEFCLAKINPASDVHAVLTQVMLDLRAPTAKASEPPARQHIVKVNGDHAVGCPGCQPDYALNGGVSE